MVIAVPVAVAAVVVPSPDRLTWVSVVLSCVLVEDSTCEEPVSVILDGKAKNAMCHTISVIHLTVRVVDHVKMETVSVVMDFMDQDVNSHNHSVVPVMVPTRSLVQTGEDLYPDHASVTMDGKERIATRNPVNVWCLIAMAGVHVDLECVNVVPDILGLTVKSTNVTNNNPVPVMDHVSRDDASVKLVGWDQTAPHLILDSSNTSRNVLVTESLMSISNGAPVSRVTLEMIAT